VCASVQMYRGLLRMGVTAALTTLALGEPSTVVIAA
jgi:hypothetical protein